MCSSLHEITTMDYVKWVSVLTGHEQMLCISNLCQMLHNSYKLNNKLYFNVYSCHGWLQFQASLNRLCPAPPPPHPTHTHACMHAPMFHTASGGWMAVSAASSSSVAQMSEPGTSTVCLSRTVHGKYKRGE